MRAVRECKALGIRTVALYTDVDAHALYVRYADEAYPIGNSDPANNYLNIDTVLDIAKSSGAEAICPGYGFLAESPEFVQACEEKGIKFIGPSSKSMRMVKPKHKLRKLIRETNILIVPGLDNAVESSDDLDKVIRDVDDLGYPVIVKPSAGGGGIGIGVAKNRNELVKKIRYAESRGISAFGIPSVYIEKYISRAKHIEFQVLADEKGNTVYLGERECSIQRRYQKLIEEAPSSIMGSELRRRMGEAALEVAKKVNYVGALTVEFIYSLDTGEYFFCEVNARLQVEHTITELTTGLNLVKEQIRIACGEELGYTQDDIQRWGWALECRINAEDPSKDFLPSPGKVTAYLPPGGFGVRVDSGVYTNSVVPFYYDPLMAKLLTWGRDRDEAIATMRRALDEFVVSGVKTTIPFHKVALEDESFLRGDYTTHFIEERGILQKLQKLGSKTKV